VPVYFLDSKLWFPDANLANEEGLLAVGGNLSPERLLLAYENGIFPWFIHRKLVYWFSPDPRMILIPGELKVSKSMQQIFRKNLFTITFDTCFEKAMKGCQKAKRTGQKGTWITKEFISGYTQLHEMGLAHSVEVWQNHTLAGGLYGVSLGKCFFGESMFSIIPNASKAGFIFLVRWLAQHNFQMIDCQIHTPHLESLGAKEISRADYLSLLKQSLKHSTLKGKWTNE
jgi:leucyl/phenylalanyl-tRNA---protein transferase